MLTSTEQLESLSDEKQSDSDGIDPAISADEKAAAEDKDVHFETGTRTHTASADENPHAAAENASDNEHAAPEPIDEIVQESANQQEKQVKTEEKASQEASAKPPIPPTERKLGPPAVGVSEKLYDFVAMFEKSKHTGAEQASASTADRAGGVTKPAIFAHPTATDAARIDYKISLPEINKTDTKFFLHFSTGLRDGVIFDDTARSPGGVKFAIHISGECCFESVSTECRWTEHDIELTEYAGQQIVLSFLTECHIQGNSNYAWALWGKPQLLKLTQMPLRKARGDKEPTLYCGTALARFSDEKPQLLEFSVPDGTRVSELAADIHAQIVNSEKSPPISSQIVALALYAAQPKLEITSVGATAAVVQAGEDFELQCTVRNIGEAPLGKADIARLVINGVKLRRGRHTQNIKKLATGEETIISWFPRRHAQPMPVKFSVSVKSQTSAGEERHTTAGNIAIRPALPKLSDQVVPELHTFNQAGHIVIGNKHLRLVFVNGRSAGGSKKNDTRSQAAPEGFEYYVLFVAKGSTYHQVATCPALSEVTYIDSQKQHQTFRFVPTGYRLAGNSGESIIHIAGEHVDADGVTWNYRGTWVLTEKAKRVRTEFQLEASQKVDLLAFQGPMLYAAVPGQNGDRKTAALFPGLEFLDKTERSSNPRDAAPPLHNRLVPHPYKITVPLMAVEMQNSLVGLIWNPLDSWDGENKMLSAIFASPNWHQHQKNTLMGLFLPTVPEWVAENQTVATTPYSLQGGQLLSIKSELIVDGKADILDAIAHWHDAYGTPKPLEPPRSDEEELLLSRHGFMHTTWDADTQKSRHCIDWPAHNEPGFGTLLWYDYLATSDETVKARVETIAKNTCAESGPAALAARGSSHILNWEFPFYVGHLDAALDYMQAETRQLIDTQEADGSWRWQPTNEKTATLGTPGEAVLGTCTGHALTLLKHARITGDKTSRDAGFKALAFMKKFTIPRGAQLWECPMYQPDLLAAALAIGAYAEAYQIAGDKANLRHAEHWAKTGLPFLYQWHLPDRPGMLFASIPVFGTTFYTHPWFGVPVQWNGLVFAYYLQHFARLKNTKTRKSKTLWQQVAEGITVSAMYQQWADGERKGTYPDGFYGFCTERRGPHLNPEDIMVNVYTLLGLDPGIKTAIVDGAHVSSGANVEGLTLDAKTGQLSWNLSYAENQTSYTLIAGYKRAPKAVRTRYRQLRGEKNYAITTTEIPTVETLETATSGWCYLEEKNTILIKYLHPTVDVQFELVKP